MFNALLAATVIASLSLLGAVFFRQHPHVTGTHRFIIPVALGMFLGIVFFELIPETLHANETGGALAIVGGFLAFYLLSHLLRTYHHHHDDTCHDHGRKSSAQLLLLGDAIHNVADGIVITTAFLVNPTIGIATTIGIALHEIPQEIAEFGVLVRSGYTRSQAALYNLLSASSIILGVLSSYLFLQYGDFIWILTGIAAGNLLYIAASDMIPELHDEAHHHHFLTTFLSTLAGLILTIVLISFTHSATEHNEEDNQLEAHVDTSIAH